MVADRFRLRYKLTPEDYQAYSKLAVKRVKSGHRGRIMLGSVAVGLLIAVLIVFVRQTGFVSREEFHFVLAGFGSGAFLTVFGYVVLQALLTRNMVGMHDAMTGEFTLAAYEGGGIQITGRHMQSSFDWMAFHDLTASREVVVLWVDTGVGVILPNSAFSKDGEKQQFTDFVNERIEAHRPAA